MAAPARAQKSHAKTPLQMLLRGQNLLGYRHYADDVVGASSSAPSKTAWTSSASSTP
ncbi:oxaloacetate decarboxylase [Salmonella enterica subsp. enterica serovar Paratyphi B str. SARA42]|nr:oxaloacetate decarboxylase [Salmonella enterica subsp. enterica serovar Paratyphi B str. SARA42]